MKQLIYVFGIFISTSIVAQDSFSLKEAQTYAIEHNADSRNAKLDLQIAEKKVWETTAMGLPQVSATGEFQNFLTLPTTVVLANAFNPAAPPDAISELQFGTDYNLKGTIQVSQLIFSGNYLVGLKASKAYTSTSQKVVEKTEQQIKQGISNAYFTVLVLEEGVLTTDSLLSAIQEMYISTKKLVEENVIESTNAAQLELSVLQVQNQNTEIKSQLDVAKAYLKLQMGYDMEKEITLNDNLEFLLDAIDNPLKIEVSKNLDYQLTESRLTLNQLSLKNYKANYLPSLAGFFSYQQAAQRYQFNFFSANESWYPTSLWGLNLSIPIFSSGQRASQVGQAKLKVQKSENTLIKVDKTLQLQYRKALSDYTSKKNVLETQKKAINIAKLIYDNTAIKYKEGVISSMELTQAQNQYLQAQAELTQAKYAFLKAKLAVDILLNRL